MNEPSLLYFCDFPPSNFAGGPVLVKRLLQEYPAEKLTVLTGSHYLRSAPLAERLPCRHIVFPRSNETGRWGIGRLKFLLDWLLIPFLTVIAAWIIKRNKLDVLTTVADGHFFIAASCASLLTGTPLVLLVHDDWVAAQRRDSYLMQSLCASFFKFAVRTASHIYAVSPGMQRMLKEEFAVDSDLQLPSTDIKDFEALPNISVNRPGFRIVYAGIGSGVVLEGLDSIARLIKSGELFDPLRGACELHLYMSVSAEDLRKLGWEHQNIKTHGWVTQPELRKALKNADLLFLPYSFREDQRFFTIRSFPSKVADYLAARKPILILSPAYATIVEYARHYGFAAIVDEPSKAALINGILRVWEDQSYRENLISQGSRTLALNHDIAAQRVAFSRLLKDLANTPNSGASGVLVPSK
jgi:glycosyltransferase involved in cell wall biosynthesis